MAKMSSSSFYDNLKDHLKPLLAKIKEDKDEKMNLKKPVIVSDNKYHHTIFYAITMFCNRNRERLSYQDAIVKYSVKANIDDEYSRVIDLLYFINVENDFDFQIDKKLLCMLLGITIESYQWLLTGNQQDSQETFRDMEEFIISTKQNSAELSTRNASAIERNLKTKAEFGGHDLAYNETSKKISQVKGVIDYQSRDEVRKELAEFNFNNLDE